MTFNDAMYDDDSRTHLSRTGHLTFLLEFDGTDYQLSIYDGTIPVASHYFGHDAQQIKHKAFLELRFHGSPREVMFVPESGWSRVK